MADDVDLEVRRATPEDRGAIVELCRRSLGWESGSRDEEFFGWKHDQNPAGDSPAWLAVAPDGQLVGVRVFLRWEFVHEGRTHLAVRAVDTATHPDWQGRGIFRRLTLGALPNLEADGIGFVFNTPNDQSRPGYLKMGWSEVGRVPVALRLGSPRTLRELGGARTAAEKWSEASVAGISAVEALGDRDGVERLLAALPPRRQICTRLTPEHLQWRYRFGPLHYRAMLVGDAVEDGLVIFRVRRRGSALEGTICESLVPARRAGTRRIFRQIVRESGADYLIRVGSWPTVSDGFVPAPRLGPILTWKPVARPGVPTLRDLSLSLGDIELL